jgi:hypothetical protein
MLVWHPSLDILVSTSYDNTIKVIFVPKRTLTERIHRRF